MLPTKPVNGPGAVVDNTETDLTLVMPASRSKTAELLQEQIRHELFAERLYISIASWCDFEGLTETAKFFSDHSKEEREHAFRFIRFIQKRGEHALLPDTEQPVQTYENIRAAVDAAISHEQFITDRIKNLYEAALEEKDYLALELAREFLAEQTEEEQIFLSLSRWLTVCEDKGSADFEMEVMNIHEGKAHRIGTM